MNRLILSLALVSTVCLLPTLVSAQECEERGHLTICSRHAEDGTREYRITAHPNASYGEIIDFANESVTDERLRLTPQQFDDANVPYVIYYCPGTDLCGGDGVCRNGVSSVVNGDSVPRHYDTACDGSGVRASRGLVAGVTYRVPAHRALTPSELVEDAHTTLAAVAAPSIADIRTAARVAGQAGLNTEHPPSTLGLAAVLNDIVSATDHLGAGTTSTASTTPTVSAADTAELENLRQQISALTAERDAARAASAPAAGLPWWSALVAFALIALAAYLGWKRGRDENGPLQDFFREQSSHRQARVRIGTLEDALKKRVNEIEELEDRLTAAATDKRAKDNSPTPSQQLEKKFSEIWNEVKKGALKSQKEIDRLLMLVAKIPDELAKDALTLLVNGSSMQLQLQAEASTFQGRLERGMNTAREEGRRAERDLLTPEFERERSTLAQKVGEMSERISAKDIRIAELERDLANVQVPVPSNQEIPQGVLETVNERLGSLHRDFFSDVLKRDEQRPSRRVVDGERVKARFTRTVEVPYANGSNGSSRRKRDRGHVETTEMRTVHELKSLELTDFLRTGYEAFDGLRRYVQGVLGLGPIDPTPAPGAFPVSVVSMEAARLPSSAEPGQDSLLDHPDDTETAEMDREELAAEPTRFFTQSAAVDDSARQLREDEATTQVVHTPRKTDIGMGKALRPPAPIAEPEVSESETTPSAVQGEGPDEIPNRG
ncbi:MAG TPA: hypothetical protein VMU11_03905 [Verrucomicrobiae bacterium]|nr:hypothetical protein [Verrucomicrobiae bacterium]